MKKRVLSFFLALALVVSLTPAFLLATATEAYATNSHTAADGVAWANARANEGWCDDVDGAYGCQCVDLILAYYDYLGVSRSSGNAYEYAYNALPSGWTRVYSNPQPGDVIVWGPGAVLQDGGYNANSKNGHIGIVTGIVSNTQVSTVETNTYNHRAAKAFAWRYSSTASCFIRPNFADAHAHSYTTSTTLPTCTEQGYTTHTCTGCGYSYKDNYVNALGHNYVDFICTRCGAAPSGNCGVAGNESSVKWSLSKDGTLTISGNGAMNFYQDRIVGENRITTAPWGTLYEHIKRVIIKSGVTNAGFAAFYGCSNLSSVTLPDSVTCIRGHAFAGCSSLTSISIPDSVTSIEDAAFTGTGLTSVSMPNSVTKMGDYVFCDCKSLESVTLSSNITIIDTCTFSGCSSLTSVVIPNGVTSIGEQAFSSCGALKYVVIPDTVTSIGEYAFSSNLSAIYYEGSEQQWSNIKFANENTPWPSTSIYYNCNAGGGIASGNCGVSGNESSVKWVISREGTLTISGSGAMADYDKKSFSYTVDVTTAPWRGFYDDIKRVVIKNGVTNIGDSAFYGCKNISSVSVPSSLNSIGDSAFYNCTSLSSISIPSCVTSIGDAAFYGCNSLMSVSIPGSVKVIGSSVFSGCKNLTSINIGNGVVSIGEYAFNQCSGIQIINIPDSVKTIGKSTFSACSSISTIDIPSSVTSIGDNAFGGCCSLISVNVANDNARYSSQDGALFNKAKTVLLFCPKQPSNTYTVPTGVTEIGAYAFGGTDELTNVTIPDTVRRIGDYAFIGCRGLKSVEIPDSVTYIGRDAFYYCTSLASVTLPNGLMSIEAETFLFCANLESITIPDSVTSIDDEAFSWCKNLTSITIPNSVTSIGKGAFYTCINLMDIVLPDGVTSMGNGAFRDCRSLTSVVLSSGMTSIPDDTFNNCKSLESITIPDSVTTICENAFSYCENLVNIYIPDSVKTIEASAFSICEKLADVYYGGTNGQWNSIKIDGYNGWLTKASIHYNHTHTWNSGVITKAAGCVTSGEITYSCTACSAQLKKEIPAAGHKYTTTVKTPTCTAQGYTTHTCSICGNSYKDSYTNALGHNYGAWKQTKAPTCTAKGMETRTCTRCNASETRDINALGHDIKHHAAKTATCTEKGWAAYDTCSRCNYSTYKEIAATGHHHNAVVTAPTCTAQGYTTHTCTACGNSYKDSYTNALGHNYANGKCTRCGAADPNYNPAPAAPELKITTSAGKPKISWDAVDGAVKYWVYRSTDGKTFKYYDSTTKTSYTNNSTTIGTTYYYKVKAVNVVEGKNYASAYSVSKGIQCKPAAPTVSINRSNGKPKLSWKAVSGATKYWIYRSTDGVNFKYWDSTTKTSYTNSGAASGTKYYYRVKAVAVVNGKNIVSANSSTKSLFTSLAKPSVSITTSNGKPKLTWKAVTGADKYYIYRSTDGKNFSYWDSTTKTTYVNSGAKKNTKYYYKVKAVCASNSNANSAQSSTVSIKATK